MCVQLVNNIISILHSKSVLKMSYILNKITTNTNCIKLIFDSGSMFNGICPINILYIYLISFGNVHVIWGAYDKMYCARCTNFHNIDYPNAYRKWMLFSYIDRKLLSYLCCFCCCILASIHIIVFWEKNVIVLLCFLPL